MFFRSLNKFSYVLVTILALLQILSPLLHAHPVGSSLSVTSGIHIHSEEADFLIADKAHTLKAEQIEAQVVGVPNGNQSEKFLLPAITLICLFVVGLFNVQLVKDAFLRSSTFLAARQSPRYLSLPLRAPPL